MLNKKSLILASIIGVVSLQSVTTAFAATTPVLGDLNGDGKINSLDNSLIKRLLMDGTIDWPDVADLNGDGKLNSTDTSLMKRYILGLITSFPRTTPIRGVVPEGVQKFLSVAKGEIGYRESGVNSTKYGQWYGLDPDYWCVMFISWCANKAEILNSTVPKEAHAYYLKQDYVAKGKYKTRQSGYTPYCGDIVIFSNVAGSTDRDDYVHAAIVEAYDASSKTIYTIEGNDSDMVKRDTHKLSETKIDGYGINGSTSYGQVP